MSFLGAFSQPFAAGHGAEAVYQPYYTHGPTGDTFYVWPAFPQSPELSPGSSEYSPPPPPYGGSPSGQTLGTATVSAATTDTICVPARSVKRRVTANRKERRRTLSINNAFAELRDCIPNVPADTKLSKIKTLRLATSYIAYLMDLLAQDDPNRSQQPTQQQQPSFKAEVTKTAESREERRKQEIASLITSSAAASDRKSRGRTGWPQHVWALELKHENQT